MSQEETTNTAPAAQADKRPSGPRRHDNKAGGNRRPRFNRRRRRKKVSKYDEWGITHIDYKEVDRLKEFVSEHGKILSRRVTGNRAKQQRDVTQAIKRARYMALLPYVGKVERPPRQDRGPRGPRQDRGPRPERNNAAE